MESLPPGLYDLLQTPELKRRLLEAGQEHEAIWSAIDRAELPEKIATRLAKVFADYLSEQVFTKTGVDRWRESLQKALDSAQFLHVFLPHILPQTANALTAIKPSDDDTGRRMHEPPRPDTPLSVSALLTGSSRSPALRAQLQKELASCDRADWLVSFIKFSGLIPLLDVLRDFTQSPAADGGPRLRIATTFYMGATDIKAIETLLQLSNTEIRISYDTKRTRLHAKAYIFHRLTGFGSAYIGSANVSKAALDEGLEWTVKVSQYETEHLWRHAVATFESHWEDASEFTPCRAINLPELRAALASERATEADDAMPLFDIRPFGFQQTILEDIAAERTAGKRKHLVIAATGTGKTMVAAFDYRAYCDQAASRPRLLFLAHREEILRQARASFRQVLRDGSFAELVVGDAQPSQFDHLFCTVASWHSKGLDRLPPAHFEYVVLDEAHHAAAATYQSLMAHIQPQVLLGLTATPERSDGSDIRADFGGGFTHEMRLPEAIERALLSPFHYYGIPDLEGLDFSSMGWRKGGYVQSELDARISHNAARAQWVLSQMERYLADLTHIRALGFCVSVQHAEFMAAFCSGHGLPAIALSAQTAKEARRQAQQALEQRKINCIFTVDLYNEGVDIPSVDTVLFLRPTESLTIFLQQLGRGLRLHHEKSHVTVLDFIAPQHRKFRYAKRFQALSSQPAVHVQKQIEQGMPFVPTGCVIYLERQAKAYVLENIKQSMAALRGKSLLQELRQLQHQCTEQPSLPQILDYLCLHYPDELYRHGLPSILLAQAAEKSVEASLRLRAKQLADGLRRLSLMDDPYLIADMKRLLIDGQSHEALTPALLYCVLWGKDRDLSLQDAQAFVVSQAGFKRDLIELMDWLLAHRTPLPVKRLPDHTGCLLLHASYTREQILLALGKGDFESPYSSKEGVLHLPERQLDVFFADINKAESDFSPTTMYEDYAITDRLFHWQSQSATSDQSMTGRRYIEHEQRGYTPLLFIRERKKLPNGLTAPYLFAGALRYVKHSGSKPMSIHWQLREPLPARVLSWARREG